MVKLRLFPLMLSGYLFLAVPLGIFALGWLRFELSVPILGILVFFFHQIISKKSDYPEELLFSRLVLILVGIVVILWPILCGIINYFPQSYDMRGRNIMLLDLIRFPWPIIYPENGHGVSYYFAHWMVPAIIGKVFGWTAAQVSLVIWTSFGTYVSFFLLAFFLNISHTKKVLVLLMFYVLYGGFVSPWIAFTESMGRTLQMYYIQNQSIGVWMATVLFLLQKDFRNMSFLLFTAALYSPYILFGLSPFIAVRFFAEYRPSVWKEIFSFRNLSIALCIMPVLYFFFSINNASEDGFSFILLKQKLIPLIIYYAGSFVGYLLFIYKDHKNNIYYYTCFAVLMAFSMFQYSQDHNFSRASLPALFILMAMVAQSCLLPKKNFRYYALLACVFFGFSRSLDFFKNQIQYVFLEGPAPFLKDIETFNLADLDKGTQSWILKTWSTARPEETFFFKYLAKPKRN